MPYDLLVNAAYVTGGAIAGSIFCLAVRWAMLKYGSRDWL